MLDRLLKDLVAEYAAASPDLHPSDSAWDDIKALRAVLKPTYKVTLRLQAHDLTAGTFLKEWAALMKKIGTQEGAGGVGQEIAYSMTRRKEKLFECE